MKGAIPVPLAQGEVAWVSPEDAERVLQFRWRVKEGYAARTQVVGGKYLTILMHKFILGLPVGLGLQHQIDHINHDKLDNRRSNLRTCTPDQNRRNKQIYKTNKVGYKGVHRRKNARTRPYAAAIRVNGKTLYLGIYDSPDEAARAYDAAAKYHFGEFACTNF